MSKRIVWKTEGPTDLLALASLGLPEGHNAKSNLFGAGENPLGLAADGFEKETLLHDFRGCVVYVVHDCDKAGQDGAMCLVNRNGRTRLGWAHAIAKYADEVRNIILPYPIEEKDGKDLRDWINDRLAVHYPLHEHETPEDKERLARAAVYQELIDFAETMPIVPNPDPNGEMVVSDDFQDGEESEEGEERLVMEAVDDPHRLASLNLKFYKSIKGRELKYWKGSWYIWKQTHYTETTTEYIRARINVMIKAEFDRQWGTDMDKYNDRKKRDVASGDYDEKSDKGPPEVRKVVSSLVHNVVEATKGLCTLSNSIDMPCWLEDRSCPHLLGMQNGLLNLDRLTQCIDEKTDPSTIADELLIQHSPNWFSTLCLDYDYLPSAYCGDWEEYLWIAMEGDQERIDLLQEWAGYLLTSVDDLQRFLCLEGGGGNGKTVFLAGIEAMVGSKNVSHVPLECFSRPFDLASTIGKVANIVGDIGELDGVAEGVLKRYTGGDAIHFDRKGLSAVDVRPSAKLMFAWNSRPNFRDRTDGVWRRLILVPFDYKVPKEKRIRGMDRPDWWVKKGQAPGILNWAIAGLYRLRKNGDFTIPEKCELAMNEYRRESNPAMEFLDEMIEYSKPVLGPTFINSEDLYEAYVDWSKKNGFSYPLGNRQFFREFKKAFPESVRSRRDSDRRYGYSKIKFISLDE